MASSLSLLGVVIKYSGVGQKLLQYHKRERGVYRTMKQLTAKWNYSETDIIQDIKNAKETIENKNGFTEPNPFLQNIFDRIIEKYYGTKAS